MRDLIKALKHGICSVIPGSPSKEIQQAAINLGAGDLVEEGCFGGWWIKDYWRMSLTQRKIARLRILWRVGGLKRLKQEARLVSTLARIPVAPPHLDSKITYASK